MALRTTLALAGALAIVPAAGANAAAAVESPFDAAAPLALGGGADAQPAFKRAPWRWQTRRITYHVAARANARAIRSAVRAWNKSGVRLRFVKTSRRRARVLIRYWPQAGCVPGGTTGTRYDGGTGRAVDAVIYMSRPDPRNVACSRWALTMVAAHELGHALGLAHEPRRCALMNTTLVNLSPGLCKPGPLEPWRWRCRILEPDDVRGAVRIYGGRARRRGRAVCDLFARPGTPGSLTATPDGFGGLAVSFVRPPTRLPPTHVIAGPGTYVVAARRATCPTAPEQGEVATEAPWSVPDGADQQVLLQPPASGRYCVAAWARDGVGRLSRKPATRLVDFALPVVP